MTNIDLGIVVAYLLFTLWVGIKYAKGTKNMELFATGGRNFSTGALAATITATYVSGSSFVIGIIYGYYDGLLDFFVTASTVLGIFITANVFAPKMGEFLGDLSVAHSMRKLFGREAGLITAICGLFVCVGAVGMQIKILASTFAYFGDIPINLSVFVCAIIMIFYSMSGGIRAVIVTDILQFITFMIVVPAIGIAIWYQLVENIEGNAASAVYQHAFNLKPISGNDYFTLFFCFLVPASGPAFFQRIIIGKNIKQVSSAISTSAYIYLLYIFIAGLIGIMLFVYKGGLQKDEIFPFMLDQFAYSGIKGLTFVAIIAMAMSTADSYLNSFAVMFTRDFCKELKLFNLNEENELNFARVATFIIGICASLASLYFDDIVRLLMFTNNFYIPIVSMPLIFAILGFRSNSSSVLKGMFAGFMTVVVWKIVHNYHPLPIDSLVPGTMMNLIVYFLAHYISGAPGGWVGPKDTGPLELAKLEKARSSKRFTDNIDGLVAALSFNPGNLLKIRTQSSMQALLGFLIIITYFAVAISDPTIASTRKLAYVLQ